jgi:hypothetical protein
MQQTIDVNNTTGASLKTPSCYSHLLSAAPLKTYVVLLTSIVCCFSKDTLRVTHIYSLEKQQTIYVSNTTGVFREAADYRCE